MLLKCFLRNSEPVDHTAAQDREILALSQGGKVTQRLRAPLQAVPLVPSVFSGQTGQPDNVNIPISLMSKLRLGDVKSISRLQGSWLQSSRVMMLV